MMHGKVVISLLMFAVGTYAGPISKVVGGHNAPPGKYPFQIITKYGNSFLCGGTILNHRYILTAAHCLHGFDVTRFKVVTGINRQSDNGTIYNAENLIIHENYKPGGYSNDIGLIQVKEDIIYSKVVQPVPLPSKNFDNYNDEVILIGFGRLGIDKPPAKTLQEVKLEIYPYSKCISLVPHVGKTHVCTLTKPGEGACNGDSGGALLAKGKQIGIVSFGAPCAVGLPDVYTRVQSYLTWIKNNSN
ncbi:chymotrypsin-2-like [Belonocnema kinseyi]|uniref:chymotrypsin-2-like n=1 Tax=Belonocnema kinseyi TaxID=2817044 RepID=UPI00143DEECA|nr:chymotrypsin-2-like [Belonocnema kinseyi]